MVTREQIEAIASLQLLTKVENKLGNERANRGDCELAATDKSVGSLSSKEKFVRLSLSVEVKFLCLHSKHFWRSGIYSKLQPKPQQMIILLSLSKVKALKAVYKRIA